MSAALAYDIDGTLDTADPKQVRRLHEYTEKHGIGRYINTARSQAYCDDPDPVSTDVAGPKSHRRHHCLVDDDPPVSKVINMEKIRRREGIADPRCVLLIDDRPENIEAVNEAGFTGIKVNAKRGIREDTVDKVQRKLRSCLSDKKQRGAAATPDGACSKVPRLIARIVILLAILVLLHLVCTI